ncbi:MAG: hypothetical protein ACU0A5_03020, partial [Salipiger marinus]|uniref:hypothetical protein n=1 Tax=Salipiger marinus TaxID=555512 RepID=UPI004059789C
SCPRIPFRLVCNQLRVPASPPPRLASRQHLSAAGEGLSTEYNKHPQPLFRKNFTCNIKNLKNHANPKA